MQERREEKGKKERKSWKKEKKTAKKTLDNNIGKMNVIR